MPDRSRTPDKHQPIELTTDFLGESRHEFVANRRASFGKKGGALSVHPTGSQRNKLCTPR